MPHARRPDQHYGLWRGEVEVHARLVGRVGPSLPARLLAGLIPENPLPLPWDADAMLLEYKQRASAGRSGCGENARPTLVHGQFIPTWSQQAMIYPEVPMDERASAWLVTETYQSGKHQPAVTNDPHHAQSEDTRLQQQSADGGLSRLRSVHVQPEESEARCQVGVAVGRSRPREIAEAVRHPDVDRPPGVRRRTAVAAVSLTVAAARIPPKDTWPDCPPVQP